LVAEFPDVGAYRRQLILGRARLAWLKMDAAKHEEAEALGRQAVALAEKLAQDFPAEPNYKGVFAYAARIAGTALVATGHFTQAETLFVQSRDVLERQASAGQPHSDWDLAMVYRELASLLARDADRLADAERSYRREIALIEKVALSDP